jgi:hypothetical protein
MRFTSPVRFDTAKNHNENLGSASIKFSLGDENERRVSSPLDRCVTLVEDSLPAIVRDSRHTPEELLQ